MLNGAALCLRRQPARRHKPRGSFIAKHCLTDCGRLLGDSAMKLDLISVDPFSPVLEFHVTELPAVIGRENGVTVRIDDRWVSHPHCELIVQDGLVWVRELNSEFGTLVNGSRVDGEMNVHSGDVITIGVRSLRVTYRGLATMGKGKGKRREPNGAKRRSSAAS
jgi:predicted component of type VI protein secretion system